MGHSLFWGILLIVIGLSVVIKIVFNVDFPIFKIVVAFFFIYLGIRILVGGNWHYWGHHRDKNSVVFGEATFDKIENGTEYNVVFGKGTFDLRDYKPAEDRPEMIKINTVFSNSVIILPATVPVKINVDAAFSGAQMPNGNNTSFGSVAYSSEGADTAKAYLSIKVDVVFGGLQVRRY